MHTARPRQSASKMAARRKPRRLARKYSLGFLVVVLVAICVWDLLSDFVSEEGAQSNDGAAAPDDARRLADPPCAFSLQQRRHGAILLHVIGLLYMFVGIAIVCDECFVPALEVITEVLDLSPDVAGATFMAAGGSAPEFFTSLIGAMVTKNDIGTGTIIGSAVFNVLFVIGTCALCSPEPLQLTWFPLARDSFFYAIDLLVVTVIFLDEEVFWAEALILFALYVAYATFMKFSERIEAWARKGQEVAPCEEKQEQEAPWATPRREKLEDLQDMDTGTAGTGEEGDARTLRVMRSGSQASLGGHHQSKPFKHQSFREAHHHGTSIKHLDSTGGSGGAPADAHPAEVPPPNAVADEMPSASSDMHHLELTNVVPTQESRPGASKDGLSPSKSSSRNQITEAENEDDEGGEDEEENEPLDIWPPGPEGTTKDWVYYVLTIPIVFLLVLTIPDVRREGWRKYFIITFFMSIMWIAAFTWAMVWFATVVAETAGVAEHIMGLTILAAGTSVPDMMTSVIVARQGHGDMAISSSIGSNIFDVTVGLPVPWLLYSAIHEGSPVTIANEGLEISVMLLLAMLAFTIGTIMCHSWVMTKPMGGSLLVLYVIFLGISLWLSVHIQDGGRVRLIHV